jgi:phosphoesterase RecJ-like protein
MLDTAETAAWLKGHNNYLILTHRRPDGDTVGSAGALVQGLREIGKTAYIFNNVETTPRYGSYIKEFIAPDDFEPDEIIIVDTASYELFPKSSESFEGRISLSIDHHPSNSLYAHNTCLDASTASNGEIIYDILMELSGKISEKSAECIYVAVSTDTGCFSFANTTSNTLLVASKAIEAGANHVRINRKLFRTRSRARITIEGMIYSGLEFYFDGKVCISSVSGDMMREAGADDDDVDDIASIPGSVKGVQCGVTMRELSGPSDCKVSVRTSPTVNANAIASNFGGGGHAMASGFSLEVPMAEGKLRLLEVLKAFFPEDA